jgi:hypothetical protein
MITGTCLCGKIEYQAKPIGDLVFNCHCTMCQRSHGAAFATQAFIDATTLKFTKGEDLITEYESTVGIRVFCSKCGSRLMNYSRDKKTYASVAVACTNAKHTLKPKADCFSADKIDWCVLDEDLTHFEALPDL